MWTRPRQMHSQQGFTLLEILLVAMLVGVLALVVTLTLPDRQVGDSPRDAAQLFNRQMHHAREQALLQNWVVGVEFNDYEYRFYRWRRGQWEPLEQAMLQPTELSQELEMELLMGDFRLLDNLQQGRSALFQDQRERDADDLPEPQLLIFESTEFYPFELVFRSVFGPAESYRVSGTNGMQLELLEGEPW